MARQHWVLGSVGRRIATRVVLGDVPRQRAAIHSSLKFAPVGTFRMWRIRHFYTFTAARDSAKDTSMVTCHTGSPVESHRDGAVLSLTLRRESAGNAFDAGLAETLLDLFAGLDTEGLRLVVLRGAGKGFCGGFDLGGLDTLSDGDLLLRFVRIEMLLQAVRHAPVPTLALAHGFAFGAGADLFAACTWRIAAPGTRFAFPGARFGIVLGTRRLAGLVGPQATMDLTLRGQRWDAEQALAAGLATGLAPAEEWPALTATLAEELATPTAAAQPVLRRAAQPDTARDADLADLVRSAALPGLAARVRAYAEAARAARRDGDARVRL